jgi:phosphoribulokinase
VEKTKTKNGQTFTYYSPRIRKITKLFKHTNVGISFKSTNTIQQLTKPKLPSKSQEHDKSGIYKLICNTCQISYNGQTSRSLKQRYQEQIRYIRHSKPQSSYALHILNNKHEYSPINNTMTLLKHINRTSLLLPYEQLYIQIYHQHKQLISEQYIGEHNLIYQFIHNTFTSHETSRSIPHHQHNQTSSILTTLADSHQN